MNLQIFFSIFKKQGYTCIDLGGINMLYYWLGGKCMLSDKKSRQKTRITKKHPTFIDDNTKLEACKLFLLTGNKATTAAALGVHIQTMYLWCNSQWFKDLTREIQTQGNIKLTNRLRTIAEKALDVTLDRLENGDWILNQKTGEMQRKPIVVRDAHRIASDFVSKANDIEDRREREQGEAATQGKLEMLAEAFAKFASKTTRIEVLDVIPKEVAHAVHDEWKEGLQEGRQVGPGTPGTEGTAGGETQGPGGGSQGRGNHEALQAAN